MMKNYFHANGLALRKLMIIIAIVLVLGAITAYFVSQQRSGADVSTRAIDYTDIVRTKAYPKVQTQINRDVKVKKVELFYRFKEQQVWNVQPMKSVSSTPYLVTYEAQIPDYLRVDSQIFYFVKFTNKDGSWITRPDGAPKSYFDLVLRLTTIKTTNK